jgi:hypothetical protein
MGTDDLTIQVLWDIRDEIRGLGARVDTTNARLDQTNARLDDTNAHLDTLTRRVVESEARTAMAITDLHGTMQQVVSILRDRSDDLRPRVERCEHEIDEIKRSIGR